MLKHYNTLLNKTVTNPIKKQAIDITQIKISWTKVLNSTVTSSFIYVTLLAIAIFIASGCGTDASEQNVVNPTPDPIVVIGSNAIPTATLPALPVSSTQAAPPVATRPPPATPTTTPSVYPTSPLATPSPTLSLLAILTQTVVVTGQQALSPTAFVYLPLVTGPLSNTAVLTNPTTVLDSGVRLASTLTDIQSDGISRTVSIPILMYHYLGTPPANADIYRRDLSVAPQLFAAQLDRMQAEGYSIISLYDLVAHLLAGASLPEKPVVLTFDDGYRDNYENAFPLLRERGLTATFFIVTDFIDRERPEYLTWDMVREMAAGGMSIEVHGVDHTTLRGRSQADLEYQALRSYETIQDRIGVRPRLLSYPAGEFDSKAIAMFRSANYWAAVTTIQGVTQRSEKPFELQRIRIRATTTPDDLIRLLEATW